MLTILFFAIYNTNKLRVYYPLIIFLLAFR